MLLRIVVVVLVRNRGNDGAATPPPASVSGSDQGILGCARHGDIAHADNGAIGLHYGYAVFFEEQVAPDTVLSIETATGNGDVDMLWSTDTGQRIRLCPVTIFCTI